MAPYLSRRILKGLLTIFVSVTITFFILRLMPADPVLLVVDPKMGPEVQAAMKAKFGLDKPIGEQYLIFIGKPAQRRPWDFFQDSPTSNGSHPGETALDAAADGDCNHVSSMLVGIPVGVQAAKQRNKGFDRFIKHLHSI